MGFQLAGFVDVECPVCQYALEVDVVDARTQASRYCPVCKVRIDFRDADGSLYGAEKQVDAAIADLTDTLGDMTMTIEF